MKSDRRPGKDPALWLLITVCVLVFGLVITPILWSCRFQLRYRDFISDLSNSTVYAYEHNGLRAEFDGQEVRISAENIYKVYAEIVNAGPGRLGKAPGEAPAAVLDYGDGSRMEFWSVKLVNPSNSREYGLFLCYTSREGETYAYDTDHSSLEKMMQYLRPASNEAWEG